MDERDETVQSLRRTIRSLQGQNAALRLQLGEVRESEERYKTLYDDLPVSLMVVDSQGVIVGVNPFHVANMGKGRTKESDYLGQHFATRRSIVASGGGTDGARP